MDHDRDFSELTRIFSLIDPATLTDQNRVSAAHYIQMIDAFARLGRSTPEMTELRAVLEHLISPQPPSTIH